MTFWDHVQELRSRLIKAMAGLGLGTALAYAYWERIWAWVVYPLSKQHLKVEMIATSPMETFMTSLKMSFIAGVVLSLPWVLWQIWAFIGPAFFENERKVFLPAFLGSITMFLTGATFCYYVVLPAGLAFLANYTKGAIVQNWKQGDYASFISQFLLAFGAIFQLPVVSFILAKLGLITARSMWSFFRYAIVIIFIVAAFLTPGPDPVSQCLLALPLIVLYLLSIGICALTAKREAEAEARPAGAA